MTIPSYNLHCPCGATLLIASGHNAAFLKDERIALSAAQAKWCAFPPICTACIGNLFQCHECKTKVDIRKADPTGSGGGCKVCGSSNWKIGV